MGAVRTKALADLRHRRLQALVIGAVLFMATGAATLALDTVVESQAPFDHAFAADNGADISVTYGAGVGATRLQATTTAAGVTASSGPWPVAQVGFLVDPPDSQLGGQTIRAGQVAGRTQADTVVDRMPVSAGRWWKVPGEVVLSQTAAMYWGKAVGSTIVVVQAPIAPASGPKSGPVTGGMATKTLTVVGIAGSISTPNLDAWMSPADIAALTPGQSLAHQILYKVAPAATTADLAKAIGSITQGLPQSAVVSSQTYFDLKTGVDRTADVFVPILVAFSLFAMLAAAFIIANVVSGIVLSSYREIGLLKAIGYTPSQVAIVLLVEIMAPVAVGAVVGVAVGTVASQPILAQTALSFGLPSAFTLSIPVVVGVLAAAALTALLAAIGPAVRAGRLSAVSAMTRGSTPSSGGAGGSLRQRAVGLSLPTPIRLGFGAGFSRPLRALMTLGALVVGVAAMVFSVALNTSMGVVATDLVRDQASPVRIERGPGAPAPDQISASIAADAGTGHVVSIGQAAVGIAELGTTVPFVAYQGDSTWIGYALISGRWFAGPGEVVAPTNFFAQSGLRVGDEVAITYDGHQSRVKLVGEIFDLAGESPESLVLRGEWSDLASIDPGLQPSRWEVQPRPGVNLEDYRSALAQQLGGAVSVEATSSQSASGTFLLFSGVISAFGIVLVAISLGGVFNTVMLETRQRIRETAVLKAIGMTPRQIVTMVVASVVPLGLLAGLIGAPLGLAFQHVVLGFMGQAAAKTAIPASATDVLPPVVVAALGLAGLAIAALGAYLPAQRAARTRIAEVLQAE